jgi:diketogulonate reductase-like aldo/keto reductase
VNSRATIALRTGNEMPVLGLGTWELTDDTAGTVAHALAIGYRMIDTACDYGSQPGIGAAIRQHGKRDDIYLVTKVEETDDAYRATKKYLGEIGVDYADLMLIHRPPDEGVGEALWAAGGSDERHRREQLLELATASSGAGHGGSAGRESDRVDCVRTQQIHAPVLSRKPYRDSGLQPFDASRETR